MRFFIGRKMVTLFAIVIFFASVATVYGNNQHPRIIQLHRYKVVSNGGRRVGALFGVLTGATLGLQMMLPAAIMVLQSSSSQAVFVAAAVSGAMVAASTGLVGCIGGAVGSGVDVAAERCCKK